MSNLYVETSALVRVLLEGDQALEREIDRFDRMVTSALTLVEAERALVRAVREKRLHPEKAGMQERRLRLFEHAVETSTLARAVLARAKQSFPREPVRSLDALHLASVLTWEEVVGELVVASCDARVRENAMQLGFQLVPREVVG